MVEYSDKVKEHFLKPRNYGKMENPDGKAKAKNPNCGDETWIYIKVGKRKEGDKEIEFIEEIKFDSFGCAAAIATASVMTELAKGKSLEEAMKIKKENVIENVNGLPPEKMHCSNLSADALHAAIEDYRKKKAEG